MNSVFNLALNVIKLNLFHIYLGWVKIRVGYLLTMRPLTNSSSVLLLHLQLKPHHQHGKAEQQAPSRGDTGPAGKHRLHWAWDPGVVQGLSAGLSQRCAQHGRIQEDLRQLLPLWRRVKVCGARLPNLRRQWRRNNRFQRVHHRPERHVTRSFGSEAEVGLQYVRPGRQRIHKQGRNAGDCTGVWVWLSRLKHRYMLYHRLGVDNFNSCLLFMQQCILML